MDGLPSVSARKLAQSLRRMTRRLARDAAAAGIRSRFHLFFSAFD
jgi:hypothetical protein